MNGTNISRAKFVLPNLYEHGLSWGEAIWTALEYQSGPSDNYYTPIGDPLARVTVYDPDADGNGVIDVVDVQAVMSGEYDVNQDGAVDESDLQLVLDVYGRSAWDMPEIPGQDMLMASDMPPSPCGDLNHDGAVNQPDLALVNQYIDGMDCPGLDINQNGIVDLGDRDTVLEHIALGHNGTWCIGDVNFDGVIDGIDVSLIVAYLQDHAWVIYPDDPDWNPVFNLDCDENIGRFDMIILLNLVDDGQTCSP